MKKMRAFVSAVLLIAIAVPVGLAQDKSDAPFRPKYDREIFRKSGTSIARPDLLACRNGDAQITEGSNVDIEEFSRTLNGVWVNQNGRSLHGVTVETDNAFYVSMKGNTGVAIMLDRNNLGDFSLTKPYLTPGSKLRNAATPLSMTFVNCTFQFTDRYIKVSDDVPIDVLAASTGVRLSKKATLEQAWKQIIAAGYFESFDMATKSRDAGAPRRKVSMATLGDGQRMAIMPDGTRIDEKGIQDGLVPGAEYSLPMMVGAFFKITLTPETEGRQYTGVHMRFDAEYRATGVALKPGATLTGVEQGTFAKEGSSYVAAKRVEMQRNSLTNSIDPIVVDDSWDTDDCGGKNGLIAAPELAAKGIDAGAAENLHESLHFERVVIGAPGLESLERRGVISRGKKQHKQHK